MEKSHYASFMEERSTHKVIDYPEGFIEYAINGQMIAIQNLYVNKESRRQGLAHKWSDEVCAIGREAGCTQLIGQVCLSDPGTTESLQLQLAYGMQVLSADNLGITMLKSIKVEVSDGDSSR